MLGGTELTRRGFIWAGTLLAASMQFPGRALSAGGDTLKLRSLRDIQVLDPAFMIGATEIDIQHACLGSLAIFQPGETLSWRPSPFVEKIEQVDDLHIAFELKPGIQWSGGFGELTAEDVKFSYERIADPKLDSPWKQKWSALKEVQVTGKHSGTIVLKEAFTPLWLTTLCDGAGSILCKKAVTAKGGKFTTEFPAVCGPYQIKRWVPKQRLELERNPLWIGKKPAYEKVDIIFIEDAKSAELAYESGDVDFSGIALSSLARYKADMPPHTKLYEGPGLWWTWMGMNTEHPKLGDVRVRRAIQNAVDVDAIIKAAYGGVETARARGIVPRGLIGYRTHTAFEKPDPDKARALLKEAGVSDLSLDIKILNSSVNSTTAQIIQANLAAVGIKLEITPLDSGPFWNLGVESAGKDWKDLQLWIMRFGDAPDPSQMTQWYVSNQVGVWNWERWKNPEFDQLNQKALVESDAEKRSAMYLRMQDIMEETGAYVWIAFEPVAILYRDSIVPAVLPPDHLDLAGFRHA
jgi:peptide/nickel transport system substrate-binding protein